MLSFKIEVSPDPSHLRGPLFVGLPPAATHRIPNNIVMIATKERWRMVGHLYNTMLSFCTSWYWYPGYGREVLRKDWVTENGSTGAKVKRSRAT